MSRLDHLADATERWSRRGIISPDQAGEILAAEVDDLHPFTPGLLPALVAAAAGLLVGGFVAATQRDVLGAMLGVALTAAGFTAAASGMRGLAEGFWTSSVGVWATLFLLLQDPSPVLGVVGLAWVWAGLLVDVSAAARTVWVLLHGAALVGALGVFGIVDVAGLVAVGSLVYVGASWFRTDPGDTARPWLVASAGASAVLAGIGSSFAGRGPSDATWMALAVGTTLLVAVLAWSPGAFRSARWTLPWDA